MSFGKSAPSPPPATPQQAVPASEIYKLDGQTQVSRLYDQGANRFTTDVVSSPGDKLLANNASTSLGNLSTQAMNYQPNEANLAKYQNMLAMPQRDAVNSAFDKIQGNSILDASGNGMAQSAGMARYLTNEVGAKRAESLADVERDAFLGRGQAMMGDFAPLEQQSNYFNAIRQGQQSNTQNSQNAVAQGAGLGVNQLSTGANMANMAYQNQLNAYNNRSPNFFQKLMGLS